MGPEENVNWGVVINQLETIVEAQKETKEKLKSIEESINKIEFLSEGVKELKEWKKDVQDTISINELEDLKVWKKKMEEIISPKQLPKLLEEFEKLKTFKTQATMIWVVVQAIMLLIMFWSSLTK